MSATIIAYPPSGGGNHLKNLLCLSGAFDNSSDVSMKAYALSRREAHSTPGRNMSNERASAALASTGNFLLHGHFGELAPFKETIRNIQDKKFVILTIDTRNDRFLLENRQGQLGQHSHEYYLHEEQTYLYQSDMYQRYFGGSEQNIFSFPLTEFWHPVINHSTTWDRLNSFLGITVDLDQIQKLHSLWRNNNKFAEFYINTLS